PRAGASPLRCARYMRTRRPEQRVRAEKDPSRAAGASVAARSSRPRLATDRDAFAPILIGCHESVKSNADLTTVSGLVSVPASRVPRSRDSRAPRRSKCPATPCTSRPFCCCWFWQRCQSPWAASPGGRTRPIRWAGAPAPARCTLALVTVVELGLYGALLAVAAIVVWRRPVVALYLFLVGLALHNAAMAALYGAGVRGNVLTAITAWKEILLAVALLRVASDAWRARALPFRPGTVDWLAVAFAALAVVYALVPQSALGGQAGHKAVALGLRHDVVPVAAFFLGRSLQLGLEELRRLGWTLLGVAALVAGVGLVDAYAVSIGWWRSSAVVDYFH